MYYNKVQFIGYDIYTGPSNPGTVNAAYTGQLSDIDDMNTRIGLMKQAISTASSNSAVDNNSGVLKIFMAPEFYFRGRHGGYDIAMMTGIQGDMSAPSLIDELATAVSDSRYGDWLFVFGTAILQSFDPKTNTYETYNVAIVQKGGYSSTDDQLANRVVIMKENKSSIDYLQWPASGLSDFNTAHLPALGDASYSKEINTPGGGGGGGFNGGSIFHIDNITFGLEICLDHAERRLVRAFPQKGQLYVQIQLIPSGGMSIVSSAVAASPNGLVFSVDGLGASGGGGYGHHTVLNRVNFSLPRDLSDLDDIAVYNTAPVHVSNPDLSKAFYVPSGQDPTLRFFSPEPMTAQVAAK
ncbi:conserved hypothetical protein [Roseibium sp. TrichSKD4]|uniref:hypothetical protein n=1 Tax=Roseibium sp. TrichSKD4 TaxID=744980 RepID=UPI0001E576D1|nr:hypothetical protein [Roseibium sp. TrichSKD4]EFO30100.1 conserved hypothetical protein [Roseibium sp. TrichSKD4]